MKTIAFFRTGNLVEREVARALTRIDGVRLVSIGVPVLAMPEQIPGAANVLRTEAVDMLLTINNWGLDSAGVCRDFLLQNKIIHANWSVDDPFYLSTWNKIDFAPAANRIDFVSDRGYVQPLHDKGYCAYFLPLGTDPTLFYPNNSAAMQRDVCFVGNSYLTHTENFIRDCHQFVNSHLPLINKLVKRCSANMAFSVEQEIRLALDTGNLPDEMTPDRAIFVLKHFAGYLSRKRLVLSLAARFPGFTVFGDSAWAKDLATERVSTAAGYYTNLCEIYRTTRVNIDINRMVIRDGFTQRIFDCLAANAFVISSYKPVIEEFFETRGARKEAVVFRSEDEMIRQIEYYISHEQERLAIAERGRALVLAKHTYEHRIRDMLHTLELL